MRRPEPTVTCVACAGMGAAAPSGEWCPWCGGTGRTMTYRIKTAEEIAAMCTAAPPATGDGSRHD